MIINNPTPYPIFKKGQQLKSSSLTGIVDFAAQADKDTHVFLEGSGIFYGLAVSWDAAAGTIRLSPGTAVTSDGQLFSLENEIVYNGIGKTDQGEDFEVAVLDRTIKVLTLSTGNENHADLVRRISDQDPTAYLLILAVRSDESSEASCLYGFENNESKKVLEVEAALVELGVITVDELNKWFTPDVSDAGDNDPVMQRFGYHLQEDGVPAISFERFISKLALGGGFNEVCAAAEQKIGDAYKQLYDEVKPILSLTEAVNPFINLTNDLQSFRTGITDVRLFPWVYDYYRDLIATYQEFVHTDVFSILSFIPETARFKGYIALGSIRTTVGQQAVNYRMGLYRPPFADLNINSFEKPLLLIKRMIYLASIANTRFGESELLTFNVKFTPDAGIDKELEERAIPFYYKNPAALSKLWNTRLSRNNRTFSIPGVTDDRDRKYLLSDIDGYNFYRIKGHMGETIENTQDEIVKLRSALHLPFDIKILYLGSVDDITDMIRNGSANFSDLSVMLEKIVDDIRCNRSCSENFETFVFKGQFRRNDIGRMFEALVTLFGNKSLDENIKVICEQQQVCEDRVCCTAQVTSLYAVFEEYARRKEELADNLLFHRFAIKHPGLEHNGGVPRGGTLVLVCAKKDFSTLDEDKKTVMMNLLLSPDEEKLAAGRVMAEQLQDYDVIADFCLPYICCSDQPSINLIFQPLPPVAKYSVSKMTALPENEGYNVTLNNDSLYADKYHWQLLDFKGKQLEDRDSDDVTKTEVFKLLIKNGAVYTVIITAYREGLTSIYVDTITICPQGNVKLTSNGKPEASVDISKGVELPLEVSPYGGKFLLAFTENDKETEIDPDDYTIEWKDDLEHAVLSITQPVVGTYRLSYFFDDLDACEDASAELILRTTGNQPKSFVSREGTNSYLAELNEMGKSDASLAKNGKFISVEKFLSGDGDYETLLTSLQTGYSKLKAAQKIQIVQLLIYATAYYIDEQLTASPDKVPAVSKKLVKIAADMIIAQKDGAERWSKVWVADNVATAENEKAVSVYKAMFA
jgi:hypothetical protein